MNAAFSTTPRRMEDYKEYDFSDAFLVNVKKESEPIPVINNENSKTSTKSNPNFILINTYINVVLIF